MLLAGVGFVGRHLTALLVEEKLTSHIRIADKAPPATGWLNDYHKVRPPTGWLNSYHKVRPPTGWLNGYHKVRPPPHWVAQWLP